VKKTELIAFRFLAVVSAMIAGILTYTIATELYVISKEILLTILGILAFSSLVLLLQSNLASRLETSFNSDELDRYKSRQTHPLYYYRIFKGITVLDASGRARVDHHMECKNTCAKTLPQIKHEINYDGELGDFLTHVNGKAFDKKVRKRVFFRQELEDDKRVNVKQPYNLKLWFDIKSEKIGPSEDFEYDYSFTCDGLYPDTDKKDVEFTGVHITNPTDLLIIRIELPKDLQFVKEGISIWVVERHDIRDCFEEERCLKLHPWSLSRDKRRITWEIAKPKIACTYKLYFQWKNRR